MIAISEEGKQAYLGRDRLELFLRFENGIVLGNDDIVAGSFNLEQTLCDEEQIVYGSIGSACLSVNILRNLQPYKGLRFSAYTRAGGKYEIPLGTFTVVEDTLSDNRRFRSLKAYDDIYLNYDRDVSSWYQNLKFPISLFSFRASLFKYVGISQEEVYLVNDDMMIERTVDLDETVLTFKMCIQAICEINGALGCITQGNNFRYVTPDIFNDALYPRDDLYPSNKLYPKDYFNPGLFPNNNLFPSESLYPSDPTIATTLPTQSDNSIVKQGSYVYKDYIVRPIEKVVIRESEEDYGTICGDGTNTYAVTGNFLCYGNDNLETVVTKLYKIISGVSYVPTKITSLGLPWVELGDYMRVIGNSGASIFPILHRTLSGISAMIDTFEAKGKEYSEIQLDGVNTYSLQQLKSRTLQLKVSVKEVSSELTYYEEQTDGTLREHRSLIQQLPHTITMKVTGKLDQNTSAGITISLLDENGKEIDSADGNIVLSGNVIFKSNLTDGVTTISGDNIRTGTMTADRVKGGTFEVGGSELAEDGSIIIKDSNGRTLITINKNGMTLYDESGNGKAYLDHGGLTISEGKVNASEINGGKISGTRIDGAVIEGNTAIQMTNFRVDSDGEIYTQDDVYAMKEISGRSIIGRQGITCNGSGTCVYIPNGEMRIRDIECFHNFSATGGKSRVIDTKNLGRKSFFCYETPIPYFGDIGEGKLNADGECYIYFDESFVESTDLTIQYQVFLQKYGEGDVYVSERQHDYFVVKGTPNLKFGWEIKAVQTNLPVNRYETLSD